MVDVHGRKSPSNPCQFDIRWLAAVHAVGWPTACFRGPNVVASIVYNVIHSYVLRGLLGLLAVPFRCGLLGEISLIWIAHISLTGCLGTA